MVVSIIWAIMILILTALPVVIVYSAWENDRLQNTGAVVASQQTSGAILIILLFTIAFSIILSLFTKAKRHQILGTTAAYVTYFVPLHLPNRTNISDQVLCNSDTIPGRRTTRYVMLYDVTINRASNVMYQSLDESSEGFSYASNRQEFDCLLSHPSIHRFLLTGEYIALNHTES